ncbi:hypothetical protein ARMSODRAFT_181014 [Armillaria solidipes]|uniref:Uncharacterized protein n=1 Tax=Armillaria solidipes TaxID=1076256 RepID=A0A2H3BED7_9AGAR|nr:hypothetical protein ARMSODRAFT_181014 [Armillaria solidipes]
MIMNLIRTVRPRRRRLLLKGRFVNGSDGQFRRVLSGLLALRSLFHAFYSHAYLLCCWTLPFLCDLLCYTNS